MTKIDSAAFRGCISLRSIIVPVGIGEIPERMFMGCSSLFHVVLPAGIKRLHSESFAGCTSLSSIDIPESVERIGSDVFLGCINLRCVMVHRADANWGGAYYRGACPFAGIPLELCVLKVPYGSRANYMKSSRWQALGRIEEYSS
jgi:hypothetical protein